MAYPPSVLFTKAQISTYVGITRIRFRVGTQYAPSQPANRQAPLFAFSAYHFFQGLSMHKSITSLIFPLHIPCHPRENLL